MPVARLVRCFFTIDTTSFIACPDVDLGVRAGMPKDDIGIGVDLIKRQVCNGVCFGCNTIGDFDNVTRFQIVLTIEVQVEASLVRIPIWNINLGLPSEINGLCRVCTDFRGFSSAGLNAYSGNELRVLRGKRTPCRRALNDEFDVGLQILRRHQTKLAAKLRQFARPIGLSECASDIASVFVASRGIIRCGVLGEHLDLSGQGPHS